VIFLWKSGSKLMAKNGSILLAIDMWALDGLLLPLTLAGMGGALGWFAGVFLTRHALSQEFWLVFKRLKATR